MINIIEGGVTAAKGFQASTAFVGMKGEGKKDLALIASTIPCVCAGVFTDNLVKGAPVLWDIERVSSGEVVQALLVNAGIANVCTGPEGLKKCERIAAAVADKMVVSQNSVLLGSTGRIGEDLPDDAIIEQIEGLCDGLDGSINAGTEAAIAMMTTDTREKQVAVNFTLSDGTLATLGGCAKGSSMVHPNMSTLLVYLTTDVKIDQPLLKKALEADVADTYNMLSIDGDTSTNDSVIVMSNGLAGNPPISDETDAD